jgi:hypothetical protein
VLVPGVLLTLLWSHEAACLLLVALSLLAASSVLLSLSVTLLLAPCESATPLTLVERTALLLLVPIAKRLSPLLLCSLLLVERLSPLLPCRLPIVERLAVAPPRWYSSRWSSGRCVYPVMIIVGIGAIV